MLQFSCFPQTGAGATTKKDSSFSDEDCDQDYSDTSNKDFDSVTNGDCSEIEDSNDVNKGYSDISDYISSEDEWKPEVSLAAYTT